MEHLNYLEFRRAHLAVLRQIWPGWTLTWAYDELADMAACVGATFPIRVPKPGGTRPLPVYDDTHQASWYLALTVRGADGELLAWPTHPVAAWHAAVLGAGHSTSSVTMHD